MQQFKPIQRFPGFFERDGLFGNEVVSGLRVLGFRQISAYRRAAPKDLLRHRRFALSAQIFMEIDDTDGKRLGLCQHYRVGHTHLLSQVNDKLRTSYLLPLTSYLSLGFRLEVIGNRFRQFARRIGGEGGIRTPGPLRDNGFQDRRDRPLRHLS